MTLVVNLFAGPGAGKSTTAARLFADLKMDGHEVEMAHEYAKDLTWEDRRRALIYQPYVIAKQMYRVHRLLGQVEIVITDSPILFGLIYGQDEPESFHHFLVDTYNSWNTLSIFLSRQGDKQYTTQGRFQCRDEAIELDAKIWVMLHDVGITPFAVEGPPASHEPILKIIKDAL